MLAQAFEYSQRFAWGRFGHLNGLKTTLQGSVLFYVLSVFGSGGGTNELDFATRQGGLKNVASIHGTLGGTSPHNQVQLVYKDNATTIFFEFGHNFFKPLFELATILSAGNHAS